MGASIVDIKNMGDALRNTGYKDIECAVSEIIDNSVEAEAKNIFIILREGTSESGRKVVTEIGFLDNGFGMSDSVLGNCLGIGSSTRRDRKGMGRFGVGLPQASLYACPEVTVYSWQDGVKNAKKVFLDINKIKDGVQKEIEDPELEEIPQPYSNYLQYRTETTNYSFCQSGTLVIWKDCDRIRPKTRGFLTEHLEFSLGRKFRYFLHDKKIEIKIISDENQDSAVNVVPNDPLFLMNDNCVLCHKDEPDKIYKSGEIDSLEPPFELYKNGEDCTGEVNVPIKYINKNGEKSISNVKVRFSIVKNYFYDDTAFSGGKDPGKYPLGKHASKMEGISIIRAGREIDAGEFDFYSSINKPQHRWWGCEIIFTPELDETFGLSNNKQFVDIKKFDKNDLDPDDKEIMPIWNQLADIIVPTIDSMYNHNSQTRKDTRRSKTMGTASTEIINSVEKDNEDYKLDSEQEFKVTDSITEDTIQAGIDELTKLGYDNLTKEQAIALMDNSVNIIYKDEGERKPPFDYKKVYNSTIVTINTSNKLYTSFLNKIYENKDVQVTFELFLASFIKSVVETNNYNKEQNDELIAKWYNKLNDYINEQLNPKIAK